MGPVTYVALLRGVNVGGRNTLAMADLRGVVTDAGHTDARTYVQSGNVVFRSSVHDAAAVAAGLEERLASHLGVPSTVVLRTADQLADVVAANPFRAEADTDPAKVHVAFLAQLPADPDAFAFDPELYAPERLAVGDVVLYLHLPGGIGRSRLATELTRRRTGVEMTLRNWRTVTRLLAMTGAAEA